VKVGEYHEEMEAETPGRAVIGDGISI